MGLWVGYTSSRAQNLEPYKANGHFIFTCARGAVRPRSVSPVWGGLKGVSKI